MDECELGRRDRRGAAPAVAARLRGVPAWLGALVRPYPPGHFHSPLPDLGEVRAREEHLFRVPAQLAGIDLRASAQLGRLAEFGQLYQQFPLAHGPRPQWRYRLTNRWFAHGDGVVLYCMLRALRPRRYVEIGSGWSSALALDVDEYFLDGQLRCTFVDPCPGRLHRLLRPDDLRRVRLVDTALHAAPPDVIDQLEPGDVLFVDSSHVSRVGSDVNQLLLEVLPGLPAGVHVQIHDIFYPFEYPRSWIYRGRAWNENYLLRAYLTHNERTRITWFNSYLGHHHHDRVGAVLPAWRTDPGSSIWLETA